MKTKSKVKTNRRRGKRAEKRVEQVLKDHNIQAMRVGILGKTDVLFSIGDHKFSCEVKTRKSLALLNWYQQAKKNAKEGEIPIVICTKFHSDSWFAILSLKDFLSLLQEKQ